MQAHEPTDFGKTIKDTRRDVQREYSARLKTLNTQRRFIATLRRISFFYPCRLYAFAHYVWVAVDGMESVKDIEPALALIEDELQVKFSKSDDFAGAFGASRTYKTECGTLQVECNIKSDAKNCHSVVVGEHLVKEYKLVCDDDAASAS